MWFAKKGLWSIGGEWSGHEVCIICRWLMSDQYNSVSFQYFNIISKSFASSWTLSMDKNTENGYYYKSRSCEQVRCGRVNRWDVGEWTGEIINHFIVDKENLLTFLMTSKSTLRLFMLLVHSSDCVWMFVSITVISLSTSVFWLETTIIVIIICFYGN